MQEKNTGSIILDIFGLLVRVIGLLVTMISAGLIWLVLAPFKAVGSLIKGERKAPSNKRLRNDPENTDNSGDSFVPMIRNDTWLDENRSVQE